MMQRCSGAQDLATKQERLTAVLQALNELLSYADCKFQSEIL
jgi:hypothetical protein